MEKFDALSSITSNVKTVGMPLGFFGVVLSIIATMIMGIAGFSKLSEKTNQYVIGALLILFFGVCIIAFYRVVKDPKMYVLTGDNWVEREKYSDSRRNEPYYIDQDLDKLTETPISIQAKESKKPLK